MSCPGGRSRGGTEGQGDEGGGGAIVQAWELAVESRSLGFKDQQTHRRHWDPGEEKGKTEPPVEG